MFTLKNIGTISEKLCGTYFMDWELPGDRSGAWLAFVLLCLLTVTLTVVTIVVLVRKIIHKSFKEHKVATVLLIIFTVLMAVFVYICLFSPYGLSFFHTYHCWDF